MSKRAHRRGRQPATDVTCIECWRRGRDCCRGSIAGCCIACGILSPKCTLNTFNFITDELSAALKRIGSSGYSCQSEHIFTLSRGYGTEAQELRLPPVPSYDFLNRSSPLSRALDLALSRSCMSNFNGIESSASLTLRYLSILCPTVLRMSEDICEGWTRLGLFLVPCLSWHLYNALGPIIQLDRITDEREQTTALTELAILYCALKDAVDGLNNGEIQLLIHDKVVIDLFTGSLRRAADVLQPFVASSCSKQHKWFATFKNRAPGLDRLRMTDWATDLHIYLDSCPYTMSSQTSAGPTSQNLEQPGDFTVSVGSTSQTLPERAGNFTTSFSSTLLEVDETRDDLRGIAAGFSLPNMDGPIGFKPGDSIALPPVNEIRRVSNRQVNFNHFASPQIFTDYHPHPAPVLPFAYGSSRDYYDSGCMDYGGPAPNLSSSYFSSQQNAAHPGGGVSHFPFDPGYSPQPGANATFIRQDPEATRGSGLRHVAMHTAESPTYVNTPSHDTSYVD